jgi:flagellar hook-basal body complex protein FliE
MSIDLISGIASIATERPAAAGPVRRNTVAGPAGTAPVETDFGAIMGEALGQLGQQLRQAEAVSISGIKGVASTQEVVEQVMVAEQTLQAAIAVRDKIIAAYLEISRMAI